MKQFIAWYNAFVIESHNIKESLIKTAIAHVYFETIHPYEDGNGRIGRALAEQCLSESLGRPLALSVSTSIEKDKPANYQTPKQAQRTLAIQERLEYFSQ